MSSPVKRYHQLASSSEVSASRTTKTGAISKTSPKKRIVRTGPYRFNFGKYRARTVEEVCAIDRGYIEDFIIGGYYQGTNTLLENRPYLAHALRTLPEDFLNHNEWLRQALEQNFVRTSILQHETIVPQGRIRQDDRSKYFNFFEALDREVVLRMHENAPDAKLAEFDAVFQGERYANSAQHMTFAFTATVICTSVLYSEEGGDTIVMLPCGWPWDSPLSKALNLILSGKHFASLKDLRSLVYKTFHFGAMIRKGDFFGIHAMKDPVPVELSRGCFFWVAALVKEVEGRLITVHIHEPERYGFDAWEMEFSLELEEGVEEPEVGTSYIFKGAVRPFAPKFEGMKFIVQSWEKTEQTV